MRYEAIWKDMLGGPTLEIWDGGGFQDDQDISRSTWTVTIWISTF